MFSLFKFVGFFVCHYFFSCFELLYLFWISLLLVKYLTVLCSTAIISFFLFRVFSFFEVFVKKRFFLFQISLTPKNKIADRSWMKREFSGTTFLLYNIFCCFICLHRRNHQVFAQNPINIQNMMLVICQHSLTRNLMFCEYYFILLSEI